MHRSVSGCGVWMRSAVLAATLAATCAACGAPEVNPSIAAATSVTAVTEPPPTTEAATTTEAPTTAAPTTAKPRPTPTTRRPTPTTRKPTPTTRYRPPTTQAPVRNCDSAYPDACLHDGIGDYDCAGGSGNGPNYVEGPIRVRPPDPFGLDSDGDGVGCES